MEKIHKLNPFKVMVDPRGFMRSPAAKERKIHWLIALMVGFIWFFGKYNMYSLGYQYSLTQLLIVSAIFALPVGLEILFLTSFCIQISGKIFKGQGSFADLYSAFAWTRVPVFFQILAWVPLFVIRGRDVFTPAIGVQDQFSWIIIVILCFQIIFSFWKVVILFHAVGEVQGFSAWIAVWNVILAWVILLCLDYGFNVLVSAGLNYQTVAMQSLLHI